MSFLELSLFAVGLSTDAFAVAACLGLAMPTATIRKALTIGLYFGFFQAAMPLAGYYAAALFAERIIAFDHWIAFALLSFLGGKMILGSCKQKGCPDRACPPRRCSDRVCPNEPADGESSLTPRYMLPLAFATSVDALVAGVTFAFMRISIMAAVSFIGITTFALSMVGVKVGKVFGVRFKAKAELAGGIVLVLIGLKTLLEHLFANSLP